MNQIDPNDPDNVPSAARAPDSGSAVFSEPTVDGIDNGLRVAPNTRPTSESVSDLTKTPPESEGFVQQIEPASDFELDNSHALDQNAALYPRERHYPTLEAMQRLTKLFGYTSIAIVFPYLMFRLAHLLQTTESGLLLELGRFFEFAVPVVFGTVGLVGLLFTMSEGLRLAMDVQDNTLRMANRSGRRKR